MCDFFVLLHIGQRLFYDIFIKELILKTIKLTQKLYGYGKNLK